MSHSAPSSVTLRFREYLKVDSLSGASRQHLSQLRSAFAAAGIRSYWRRRAEQMESEPSGSPDPVRLAWMWARTSDTARTVKRMEMPLRTDRADYRP